VAPATATPTGDLSVAVVDAVDADDDGAVSAFTLRIAADTRLRSVAGDAAPYVAVAVEGTTVATTGTVERSNETTVTVVLGRETLARFDEGTLSVTVTLFAERDGEDDPVATWSGTVEYEQSDAAATTRPGVCGGSTNGTPTRTAGPDGMATATATSDETATPMATSNGTPTASERTAFEATVVRVVDGDTVQVRLPNGSLDTVRLLGVDTPEVHDETDPAEWEGVPDTDAGREHLRTWAERASRYAKSELAEGERIRLRVDGTADRRDRYGRLLAIVCDDGALVNLRLLRQGYARLYDTEFAERARFESAERHARSRDVGVWNVSLVFNGTATGTASTATATPGGDGDLAVVEVHADAEGDDHENLDDEYVVLENTGEAVLELSGWRVEDEAGHTYRFPDGFTLAPGERVALHTGSGEDTTTELYWGSDSAVWNNGGDTVRVYDRDDRLVVERTYE
jgi:micrococcal nuclease